MAVLQALPGVGMGVASAILTLTSPQDYGVIDFRVWELVFGRSKNGERKQTFTAKNYLDYLKAIRCFAIQNRVPTQHVDFALWKAWETE